MRCIAAVHLVIEFRRKFHRDIIIDLIGYRRFGHNEQDEPAYTQPGMYDAIKAHPSSRELFANKLIAQGIVTAEQASAMETQATTHLQEVYKTVKGKPQTGGIAKIATKIAAQKAPQTAKALHPVRIRRVPD